MIVDKNDYYYPVFEAARSLLERLGFTITWFKVTTSDYPVSITVYNLTVMGGGYEDEIYLQSMTEIYDEGNIPSIVREIGVSLVEEIYQRDAE